MDLQWLVQLVFCMHWNHLVAALDGMFVYLMALAVCNWLSLPMPVARTSMDHYQSYSKVEQKRSKVKQSKDSAIPVVP